MFTVIYGIIILIATFLGSFAGLGGGIIIKPLLDLAGHDTIDTVNFISSCAVFSMSISSMIKHIKSKTEIKYSLIITLSAGAIIGGICGSALFNYLLKIFDNDILKNIQGFTLGILLIISVIYINHKNAKSFNVKNNLGIVLAGLILGFIASFLGIGGGPINVAFLVLFFSMSVKDSAVYSVGIIFFSQLSKLITTTVTHNIPQVDAITIIIVIICAVAGGILGTRANKSSNEKTIKAVFTVIVSIIAIINLYNGIK